MSLYSGGAVILGSGPSLAAIDVSRLRDYATIAFNRAYVAFEEWGFAPTYYACIDQISLQDNAREISELARCSTIQRLFLRDSAARFGFNNEHRVRLVRVVDEPVFSLDFDRLGMFNNVAAVSVQILAALKFKRILMFGIDGHFERHPSAHPEERPWLLRANADDDPNHFVSNYHGAGRRFTRPNSDKFMHGWRKLAESLRGRDVEVRNATEGSAVEYLPRIGMDDGLAWLRCEME